MVIAGFMELLPYFVYTKLLLSFHSIHAEKDHAWPLASGEAFNANQKL